MQVAGGNSINIFDLLDWEYGGLLVFTISTVMIALFWYAFRRRR